MSRLKICLFIKNWIKNILNDMKTILLIDVKIYFLRMSLYFGRNVIEVTVTITL